MDCRLENRCRRRLLDDPPGIHDQHPVGDLTHHGEVVGDQEHRHAEAGLQAEEQIEDLRLDGDVERGRRLVRHEQVGIAADRHGDHHPLAHAARELVRIPIGQDTDWLTAVEQFGEGVFLKISEAALANG